MRRLLLYCWLASACACSSSDGRVSQRAPIESGNDGASMPTTDGPRKLLPNAGDKTLDAIHNGYLYFKPGLYRVRLDAPRDEKGQFSYDDVEKIWPAGNPFDRTWFVDGIAYWSDISNLYEWPLDGKSEPKTTPFPNSDTINWYAIAVNQKYIFAANLGCKRIIRYDRKTKVMIEATGLPKPQTQDAPELHVTESRIYCAALENGWIFSLGVNLDDQRMHVVNEERTMLRMSLADDGYLYFTEDGERGGRLRRLNLATEEVELLWEGKGWAMTPIQKLDERRIAWLSPGELRVLDLDDRSLREFPEVPYFDVEGVVRPGVDLLFDDKNVYWFRIADGGHIMVTPRSFFGI